MKIGNLFVNGKIQSLKRVIFPQINYNEFKVILKIIPARLFIDPDKLILRSTEWRIGQIILKKQTEGA